MICCHPSWGGNIGGSLMVYTNTDLHCFRNTHHNHSMSLQKPLQKPAIGHMPRDYASTVLKQTSTVQRVVDYPMEKEKEEEEVDCHSVPALDVPLLITGNMSFQDDEMMSWLMYPSDGTFDRPYGSDLFGDFINPHLHLVKDVFIHQTMKESEMKTNSDDSVRIDLVDYESEKTCDDLKRVYPSRGSHKPNDDLKEVSIDGHESEKANDDSGRFSLKVHGLDNTCESSKKLDLNGHESEKANDDSGRFSLKVHGLDNTCESSKKLDLNGHESEKTSDDSKRLDLYGYGLSTHMVNSMEPSLRNKKVPSSNPPHLEEKRIPSLHPCEEQNEETHYKFPLFSRAVAATRDSLRILGAESGPTNIERARKPLSRDLILSSEVSSAIHWSCPDTNVQLSESKKPLEESNTRCLKPSLANNHSDQVTPRVKESSMGHSSEGRRINRMAECEQNLSIKSDRADHISGCTTVLSECGTGMVDIISSPSMISASVNPSPTRFCSNEESQDVENVITIKKPQSHLKRSRAAETHNESEKRRRDRINVKLKALQDLIPNSTKTDKASILDDAIRYLKMLQAQVQLMSTRSNFVFPPVMMSAGLQYVPMQGISTLPQMGVRDMIGPHQPVIQLCPMPPWQPLQAYHGTQIVHALSPIVQAPACYLPTSMPTQFEMQRNMRNNVSMQ